ncbi:MAG: hypothetical protein ACP5GX_08165 [Anaerolineae bacterium]
MMKSYGFTTIADFLGDLIVYRKLEPMDSRLPRLRDFHEHLGMGRDVLPRKNEPAYARVIVHLLRLARALDAPNVDLRRLIYVGDDRTGDGAAFNNLSRVGDWPGLAFIGAETSDPTRVEVDEGPNRALVLANRWSALYDFDALCAERGFPIDVHTAVVIDLDKTALGARGRNDHVIDRARMEAARRTLADALGRTLDPAAFERAYDHLNRSEFHPFTTDNQDYLVYLCLILGTDLYDLESLVAALRKGKFTTFEQFIAAVDEQRGALQPGVRDLHDYVYDRIQRHDPTPFKDFRRREYEAILAHMGRATGILSVPLLLNEEVVITEEVRRMGRRWGERGALLFGISDKPDEASLPSATLAAHGYPPLHRAVTRAVGTVD